MVSPGWHGSNLSLLFVYLRLSWTGLTMQNEGCGPGVEEVWKSREQTALVDDKGQQYSVPRMNTLWSINAAKGSRNSETMLPSG